MSEQLTTNTTPSRSGGAMIDTEGQRAIQEVQAALTIAKRFPRDVKASIDRILNACSRPSLAGQALYSYAKGGQDISGPSIRLAEAVAQQWGNLQYGIRELEQRNGESTVEAFAWDLETNTRQVKVFQVPHTRYTRRDGNKPVTDPREVYELVANQGARRLRACILGVIPGDIIDDAVNQCEATQAADADTSPEAQLKMIEAFAVFGVTKDQIEKRIQRRLDSINPAQVISLRKIRNSMRDGMSSAADWFEPAQVQAKEVDPFKEAEKKAATTKPEPTPEEKPLW